MASISLLVLKFSVLQLCFVLATADDVCNDRQFKCRDGQQCIPLNWQCDGETDCRDQSDELNCRFKPCGEDEYRCASKKCIMKTDLCDGFNDCPEGDDETHTLCAKKKACNSTTHFTCGRGEIKCVPIGKLCDGNGDCADESDENYMNCHLKKSYTPNVCRGDEFNCTSGGCVSLRFKCDGKNDCADGSDEKRCEAVKGKCGSDEFRCADDGKCISLVKRCDTFHDCKDGSDERNCVVPGLNYSKKCPLATDFYCGIPGKCITQAWRCDGEPDCPNAADERDCTSTTCPPPKLACNKGNKCVHPAQKCDGIRDCPDGSDEIGCPKIIVDRCSNSSKYICGSKQKGCVEWSKVCDNKNDCLDGEDERPGGKKENCNLNPCKKMNGGCTHTCVNRFTHHYCECPKGLKLQADKRTCVDINECKIWGSCSQMCENTKGSFKCSCQMGYVVDKTNKSRCIANSPKSLLLATQEYIREYHLDNYDERMVVSDLINVAGLEYDLYSDPRIVFWTQPTPPALYMATFGDSEPQRKTEVYSESGSLPEGLAYDWVHKLLYMSDPGLKRIAVLNISSPTKQVVQIATGDIDEPRALAVDPYEGWLYWTDWGRKAMISKIGMNGQFRQVLVDTEIVLPNALALDMPQRRLYWCDAKLHTISTVDLNGNDRRLIYKDPDIYPYAMSVFEDRIYWSDWYYESVMSVNKFQASTHQTLFNSHRISAIRVMHNLMQPKIMSRCLNHHCSHFCLPAPRAGNFRNDPLFSCACPVGFKLLDDDRTCVKNTTMTSTTKSPQIGAETPIPKSPESIPGSTSTLSTTTTTTTTATTTTIEITSLRSTTAKGDEYKPGMKPHKNTGLAPDPNANKTVLFKQDQKVGHVAGIAIGIILLIFAVGAIVMLVLYRFYSRKNVRSMNFDNPVYRKANSDGDAEAQFPINGTTQQHTRVSTRSPIWTGGVANDAVEA